MYDVVIIGGGPSGVSAGLYTKRANKNTLIIYQEFSNLEKAESIQNYYGFENGISGQDLYENGLKQAKNIGIDLVKDEVINIKSNDKFFKVETFNGEFETKTVILAIGNKKNKSNVKGIEKFEGKGVSYCAICDGFFYRDKEVAVLGDGNYAKSETKDLVNIAKKIYLLTNGKEDLEFEADNVEIISKPIEGAIGNGKIEGIVFNDGSKIQIDGLFIAQGVAGSMELSKKVGILTEGEKIIVDDNMKTNIDGIYACGDCIGGVFQVSKSVYDGTKAGLSVINFLNK